LIGGLLILLRRRWLWIIGAVINALVILFFVQLYQNRPVVFFSPGGLVSKAAQQLLETALLYLIAASWRSNMPPSAATRPAWQPCDATARRRIMEMACFQSISPVSISLTTI
jgi:hypothetical protein